jgi:hypothetical protein
LAKTLAQLEFMSDETNPTPDWVTGAIAHLTELLKTRETVSADDLQGYIEPPHPNKIGAVFRRMNKSGSIRKYSFKPSSVKAAHGRKITIWKRVDSNGDQSTREQAA